MTDRRLAAALVEEGLAQVFPTELVGGLREDSPLAVLGLAPEDLVAVSDAVGAAAARRGAACRIADADLLGLVVDEEGVRSDATVADLVAATQRALARGIGR
jgi:hypothetical protein